MTAFPDAWKFWLFAAALPFAVWGLVVRVPQIWRGETKVIDSLRRNMGGFWFFSRKSVDTLIASMPAAGVEFLTGLVFGLWVLGTRSAGDPAIRGLGDSVGRVVGWILVVLMGVWCLIIVFGRPRRFVPPWARGKVGLVQDWKNRRLW